VPVQYKVRGAYLNPYEVAALNLGNELSFEEIGRDLAINQIFSSDANEIGWEWKSVSLEGGLGVYTVESETSYLVRSVEGLVYKIRFVRYIDDNLEPGYPQFDFQQL